MAGSLYVRRRPDFALHQTIPPYGAIKRMAIPAARPGLKRPRAVHRRGRIGDERGTIGIIRYSENPSNMKVCGEPVTDAGCDYKGFAAARKR
jgi:hypothetical protein